jgi:hypothetical protein
MILSVSSTEYSMEPSKEAVERLIEQLRSSVADSPPPPPRPPLNNGGSGGNYDGMEARVAKLEAHMEHVRSDLSRLSEVPTDLGIVKTKVEALPSKGYIVTATVAALAFVAAISAFIQWVLSVQG